MAPYVTEMGPTDGATAPPRDRARDMSTDHSVTGAPDHTASSKVTRVLKSPAAVSNACYAWTLRRLMAAELTLA